MSTMAPTTTLAEQQSALIKALTMWPRLPDVQAVNALPMVNTPLAARGLNAYRANAHACAHRALQSAYPVLAQLLGDESFEAMSHAFWHAHPPERGDWAQWGGALAAFVARDEQLRAEAYLPDVARLEWQMHQLASAADATPETASLQLLMNHDPSRLTLAIQSQAFCWRSQYPVVSLVRAHLDSEPDLREAAQLLRQGTSQTALVWRQGYRPCVREALPGELDFLRALMQDRLNLTQALSVSPELDFESWLIAAVQTQLLLAVELA